VAEYAKTAAVKAGIIDACLSAFGEAGFHGVSMSEVARRAGISYTGLTHHFPRKEDLLTAVLERQDVRAAEFLRVHDAEAAGVDPLELLRGVTGSLEHREEPHGLAELTAVLTGEATATGHPAHAHFRERYARMRSFITRLFTRLQAQGRLASPAPAEQQANTLIALVDGLRLQWLYEPGTVDMEAAVRAQLELMVVSVRS